MSKESDPNTFHKLSLSFVGSFNLEELKQVVKRLFHALMEEQKPFYYFELLANTEFYLVNEDISICS